MSSKIWPGPTQEIRVLGAQTTAYLYWLESLLAPSDKIRALALDLKTLYEEYCLEIWQAPSD
jgi:hypothetical protein